MVRPRKGINERHKKILDYLAKRQENQGYPPSIREIGEATGISSTSVVTYYLKQLEELNFIQRDHNVSRGVRLTSQVQKTYDKAVESAKVIAANIQELLEIPILGRIVAGEPITTPASDFTYFDAESNIQIARSLLSAKEKTSELFALEVEGTSMIDAMVNDGDLVIMKKAQTAQNGEMVAVWLKASDQTTLKYFYKEGKRIRLQPANPTMEPIFLDSKSDLIIQGKVVMVIRKVDSLAI
ncbi:transcriptional repressor LexA [Chloroflexota bacterium]